jgi:hypothetical protein
MGYGNESEARREDELLAALFASVTAGDIEAAQRDLQMIASGLSGKLSEMAAQARFDRHRPYRAHSSRWPMRLVCR